MNSTELRERVCKRLYGDAWRMHWEQAPEALEIQLYKQAWIDATHPLVFEGGVSNAEIRQWHKWFANNDISRLDYDIRTQEQEDFAGHTQPLETKVLIRDDEISALFKLTFYE